MSKGHNIRCYDYVNHSYDNVCSELIGNSDRIFREATSSAASRAEAVAAGLHVNVAGLKIGKEIDITVHDLDQGRYIISLRKWPRICANVSARAPS